MSLIYKWRIEEGNTWPAGDERVRGVHAFLILVVVLSLGFSSCGGAFICPGFGGINCVL